MLSGRGLTLHLAAITMGASAALGRAGPLTTTESFTAPALRFRLQPVERRALSCMGLAGLCPPAFVTRIAHAVSLCQNYVNEWAHYEDVLDLSGPGVVDSVCPLHRTFPHAACAIMRRYFLGA